MTLNESELRKIFHYYFVNLNKIPLNKLKQDELDKENDGIHFFYNNLFEMVLNQFKINQPKSYLELREGREFYAIKKYDEPMINDHTQFGIILNDMAIYIDYSSHLYEGKIGIPDSIKDSWLYHCYRWNIAERAVMNIIKTRLPSLLLMPLHSIIDDFENKKNITKNSEFLEQKFNHAFRRAYGDERYFDDEKYFELRCLLDTRPNEDYSKSGFQLFVSSHNNERNVYVIPNADVTKIQLLDNAADAIDSYAAHLFSRKEGEFDFWQYTKDF